MAAVCDEGAFALRGDKLCDAVYERAYPLAGNGAHAYGLYAVLPCKGKGGGAV